MLNCQEFSELADVLHQLCMIRGYISDRETLADDLLIDAVRDCATEALSKFSSLDIAREDVYDSCA